MGTVVVYPQEGGNKRPESDSPVGISSKSVLARTYRGTWFNVVIVGLISFTQAGIWNALYNVGAGGQQEPYVVNGANALTFGLMVFGCTIFSGLINKLGLKTILIIGTLGYAPYSAALYCNSEYGTQWFIFLGAVTCGISASALFASEGAIALSVNRKNGHKDAVGYSTYLALIGIQCAGLPLAFLVSPPHKAIRSDGTLVSNSQDQRSVFIEFKRLWELLKTPKMYLLIPVMVTFLWNSTYQGIYLTMYFSVRARTLASLTSAVAMIAGDVLWGWFLSRRFFGARTTAKVTWIFFGSVMLGLFGWQFANEHLYEKTNPTFDWVSPGFARAFVVNLLFAMMNESHYVFVYWLLGSLYEDPETINLAVGWMRTFESLGSALAFAVGSSRISPMKNLIVSFVLFVVAIPPTIEVT
ncbi:hypothetical protein BJX64DRAFT_278685 [Aspergillus heterothallicus]